MRRARGYGFAAACLVAGIVAVGSPAASPQPPKVVGAISSSADLHPFAGGVLITPKGVRLSEDRLLVRFKPSADAKERAQARAAAGTTRGKRLDLVPGLELIEVGSGQSAVETAAKLSRDSAVDYATPDVLVPVEAVPNDPQYSQLWGLTSIGAPAAWDRSTGSASVRVGVLDTGIQANHPDLAANVWTNAGEIAGNGIDDDANGYVDDVHGWDFQAGDNDPSDVFGHGTHVAGTIGAVGNNGIGVTGVNWHVTLLPLKVCGDNGLCSLSAEIEALDYAADHGVKVVNASFGGYYGGLQAEEDAIAAAGAAGVLFVASAGNNASDNDANPTYPAGYDLPNVVSVAALQQDESLASFSNYGLNSVDLAAPGQDVLSTIPGGTYGPNSGTSMAAPHVTGAAALLLSLHPAWTPVQIRARLLATARGESALAGKVNTCGTLDVDAATDSGVGTTARLCVHRLGTGGGTVSSSPPGIDCGASCAASFGPGTNVTLTATPAAGSTFTGWLGACTGTDACSVTVSAAASVRATFRQPGTPPYWTEAVLPPPSGRAPTLPKTEPQGSFFNVSLSADGLTRAKTIFNAREQTSGGIVVCQYDTTDTGGVYLERKVGGVWTADGALTAPAVGSDPYARWANCPPGGFGSVTELSGDGSTLLTSQDMAPVGDGTYRCAAFVYRRGVSTWSLDGTLFPPGIGPGGSPTWDGCRYFGIGGAISDDGSRVAILSFLRADIFVRTGGVWTHEQRLTLPDGGDAIASRYIALSGDGTTLLVSDPWNGPGVVYAYGRSGSTWTLTQTIAMPEACFSFCVFGSSLALSRTGTTAAIAVQKSPGLPDTAGAVWAYERDALGWHARKKLTATPPEVASGFACPKVVRDGARFICGSWDTVGFNARQGSLYLADRLGSSWVSGEVTSRAFVGGGFAEDYLGAIAFGMALTATADGLTIEAPIWPSNVIRGLYGPDRIGYSFTAPTRSFADVPPANPFYSYIERLFAEGITTGCGTNGIGARIYCPNDPVPRQQMAAFLIRAKGLTQLFPATPSFIDVPISNPFFGYIERLREQGITTGCNPPTNNRFCPDELVPRQQMAAFLIRAKGLTQLFPATPSFLDVPASNPFFGYIERLKEQGITTGCNPPTNNLYCPLENVPRQQMAAFLIRAFFP